MASRAVDMLITYRVVKLLVTPWEKQEAFKQGIIDKKGNVTEAWVQKGIPNTGLDEAALKAVKNTKWKPAQQRDKKVGVWLTVPVLFQLNSN